MAALCHVEDSVQDLTAVCTVIDPPIPSVMLPSEKSFCASANMLAASWFNRTANRCHADCGIADVLQHIAEGLNR